MTLKIDSCSLIYVTKAGLIPLLQEMYGKLIITEKVFEETVTQGTKRGYPDAFLIWKYVIEGTITVIEATKEIYMKKISASNRLYKLGQGEWETIIEAKNESCTALIDDLLARKIAKEESVTAIPIDIVLIEALIRHKLTENEFYSLLNKVSKVKALTGARIAEIIYLVRLILKYLLRKKFEGPQNE